jgi:hypothetical protein
MNPRVPVRAWPLVGSLAAAVTLQAALAAGGVAFTKRLETKLLAEPSALAPMTAKVGYARRLTVEETRGAWLKVSEGANAGWVFAGNVSEQEIKPVAGSAGLGLNASETTVTAAARGLSEVGADYAQRHKLTNARDDLSWLLEQSAALTPEELEAFLQERKLGEYK